MGYKPTTIIELADQGINRHEGEVLIATKRNGNWIETSRGEFVQNVRSFSLGLYELGVRKGDRVSIHSENSAEWLICDQAVLSLGAVSVPLYTTQPGSQIKYILEDCKAKAHIVSNDRLFRETKPLIKSIESIQAVITILGSAHSKLRTFEAVLKMGEERDQREPTLFDKLKSDLGPDDLATLIYTSGTTGDPKGVMLSHSNITSNLQAALERVPFDPSKKNEERMLSYLPLSHVFERLISYLYLYLGYPIYYIEEVEQIREDLQYVRPYFLATVPRLLEKIYTGIKIKGQELSGIKKRLYYWAVSLAEQYDPESPPAGLQAIKYKVADKVVYSKIRKLFGGRLLGMISGGAALSPQIFRFFNALGFYCGQGYGLTETSPVIAATDPGHLRIGSSGLPLSNVEVKIAADGEILVRGPNVMMGYYQNSERTREVLTDEGWLKTGDIGRLEDGYLYITDRKKSIFKLSTGKFVAPQVIENRLVSSGYIEQAMVIGYQRKFCSALIVPNYENIIKQLRRRGYSLPASNPGQDKEVQKLIQQEVEKVNQELSPWETVKKFVVLEEPFSIESGELTPTMKVKRTAVNERYGEHIEGMYKEVQVVGAG